MNAPSYNTLTKLAMNFTYLSAFVFEFCPFYIQMFLMLVSMAILMLKLPLKMNPFNKHATFFVYNVILLQIFTNIS